MSLPTISGGRRGVDMYLVAGMGVIQAVLMIVNAFATRDLFIALHSARDLPMAALLTLVLATPAIAALQAFSRVRAEAIGQSYSLELRQRLFEAIAGMPTEQRDDRRLGGLSLRFVGDLSAARGWVGLGITRLLSGIIVLPMAGVCLWWLNPTLALTGGAPILLAVVLSLGLGSALNHLHRSLRRRRAGVAIAAMERIGIARELALMNRLPRELGSLERKGAQSAADAVRRVRRVALLRALPSASLGISAAAMLWATAQYDIAVAEAAAALSVLAVLVLPLKEFVGVWDRYNGWCIARDKCRRLMEQAGPVPRPRRQRHAVGIDLDNVSIGGLFLNLTIRPGQCVRIAARDSDQAGLLLEAMALRRRCDAGTIRYGTGGELPMVAYVCDSPTILRGSLRRALTLAAAVRPVDERLKELAADCGLGDLLERVGGLEGRLAEQGRNLLPGERLRLAVAQALTARPDIIVVNSQLWPSLADGGTLLKRLVESGATLVHALPEAVDAGNSHLLVIQALDREWQVQPPREDISGTDTR
ncbi:ABC transporter transmembrane domain-containing protein [Halomonas cupida]|uniref:ATP-binding cassette, subfamily B n=2 Tax=Halomonas cupida TaxID=44933 RepID=A0A1M7M1S9_9GAMM|nr:ABC transporter transmembrane domain-containing protein [Halomonas cupida]SHM84610.1 ATP-binding cassette, subfamily B [Halomonas cupida]